MSPQNLCPGQRFNCHFLEADLCHDVNHNEPANDACANADRPPLQPSSGSGGHIAGGSGVFGVSRTCGLKFGAVPAELSAVIPPMKRRLITLSTAGNLKISPLSTQQLHHHRIYPVRRPSLDGGAAAVLAVVAPAEAREANSQQSQPPPPPSTPARQPHTPSSHLEGIRRELSPREDSVLQGVFYIAPSSPEPSQPLTPRPISPGVSSGGGAPAAAAITAGAASASTGMLSTPYLILRPVRSVQERMGEDRRPAVVVSAGGVAPYSESPARMPCAHQQPFSVDVHAAAMGTRLSTAELELADGEQGVEAAAAITTAAAAAIAVTPVSMGVTATAATPGPALGPPISIPSQRYLGGQNWLAMPGPPLFVQETKNDEKDNQQQHMSMLEHTQHTQHAQAQQAAQLQGQPRQQLHDQPHSLSAEPMPTVDHLGDAKSAVNMLSAENGFGEGHEGATALGSGSSNAAANVSCGDVAPDNAAAEPLVEPGDVIAATATAASDGGLSWTSIEVMVAVRPKAGSAARRPGVRVAGSQVPESQNGYVRGPVCGVFDLTRYLTGRDCVRHCGRWLSRSQFEKTGGSTMAKWYRSIRVLPDLEPLGEWLERHDMPVLRGPARRSRKRPAGDSGDEICDFQTTLDRITAPKNDSAAGVATTRAEATMVEGDWDANVGEKTWATCMPLQDRNEGGGGGGVEGAQVVQQLLGTAWPFHQTAGIGIAAAAGPEPPVDENAAAGGVPRLQHLHSQTDPYHDPIEPEPASLIPQAALKTAALSAVNPNTASAAVAELGLGLGLGAGTVQRMPVWGMAAHETSSPKDTCSEGKGAAKLSEPLLELPVLRSRVSSLQLSSPPRSPRAPPNPQLTPENARKLPVQILEQSRAMLQGRQFQKDGSMSGGLAGVFPPPPQPPPVKRARTGEAGGGLGAPLRPRLLLHRTSVSEGHAPEHPYLFAVQAPLGMLYRENKALEIGSASADVSQDVRTTDDQKVCPLQAARG